MKVAALVSFSLLLAGFASGSWSVGSNRVLVWENQPYIPVGLRVNQDEEEIRRAHKHGIRDLIVDLSADGRGWRQTFELLDSLEMRYVISISSLAPGALVHAVEPDAYRLPNLRGAFRQVVQLPGVQSAVVVLASQRDSTILWAKKLDVDPNGTLVVEEKRAIGGENVLLITPLVSDLRSPDAYEGFDRRRDELLGSLKASPPGKGYRGLLNPMGRGTNFVNQSTSVVPTSPLYRFEMEHHLQAEYGSLNLAQRAWGFGMNDITSFRAMARLIPLWSNRRGVPSVFDPETGRTYPVDTRLSVMWADIRKVMQAALTRRYRRLVQNIRLIADGPVIQTWEGWTGPYAEESPWLNGIGFAATNTSFDGLLHSAARPVSSLLRATRPLTAWATQVDLKSGEQSLSPTSVVAALEGLGVRGVFFVTQDPVAMKEIAELAKDQDRLAAANQSPNAVFFPDAATDPAEPKALAPGLWWLPSPMAGQRLDFGWGFFAYRLVEQEQVQTVLWIEEESRLVRLKAPNPGSAIARTVDGKDVPIRRLKDEIELKLSRLPVIIEGLADSPVPLECYEKSVVLLAFLADNYTVQVDPGGTMIGRIREFALAFDRNPPVAIRRIRELLNEAIVASAPFSWADAERSQNHTFSTIEPLAGASNGEVLTLRTAMRPSEEGFMARFDLRRRQEGLHEVWVLARVPEPQRQSVFLEFGGRTFGLPTTPETILPSGLGWYRVGEFSPEASFVVRLIYSGTNPDIAVDVVVAAPKGFRPIGSTPPVEWVGPIRTPIP